MEINVNFHWCVLLLTVGLTQARNIQKDFADTGNNHGDETDVNTKAGLKTDERYQDGINNDNGKRAAVVVNYWIEQNVNGRPNKNFVNGKLVIPYEISSSLSSRRPIIMNTIASMNKLLSCHNDPIVPRDASNSNMHYLRFILDNGCYSYVGLSYYKATQPSSQVISIGNGCQVKGIISHEIMHALGFHHEQSRPDRDNYVTINRQNIRSGFESNFNKQTNVNAVSRNSPYDYASVMHYGSRDFSRNGQETITTKKRGVRIGQRDGLSPTDVSELKAYFKCDTGPTTRPTAKPTTTTTTTSTTTTATPTTKTPTTKTPTTTTTTAEATPTTQETKPTISEATPTTAETTPTTQETTMMTTEELTIATTAAPATAQLLAVTSFPQLSFHKSFYYGHWISKGCVDLYGNCWFYKHFCNRYSSVRRACPSTCGCVTGIRSHVVLPPGRKHQVSPIARPNIQARIMKRSLAITGACPTVNHNQAKYKFCTRVIYKRVPDRFFGRPGSKSKISFAAYNFDRDYFIIGNVLGPYTIGSGNENQIYYYQATKEYDLYCENMDFFIVGQKGGDDIEIYKFEIFSGSCSALPKGALKREVDGLVLAADVAEDPSGNHIPAEHIDKGHHKNLKKNFIKSEDIVMDDIGKMNKKFSFFK